MRRSWLAILAVFACGAAGCFLLPPGAKSIWPGRSRPVESAAGADVVYMDISVLRSGVGDRYVNDDLWTAADEQLLTPALQKKIQENGLRVGVVSGRTPDGLLGLLTNARSNPSAFQALRPVGKPAEAPLASELPQCQFALNLDGIAQALRFEQASCRLEVVPTLEADGKVRLQFTPQLEYRDPEKWARIDPAVALTVQGERSTETVSALRWELVLGANDYAVVGTRYDWHGTLGHQFFITPDPDRPVQRLLAIRAGRYTSGARKEDPAAKPSRTLASQAASQ